MPKEGGILKIESGKGFCGQLQIPDLAALASHSCTFGNSTQHT
jgi:hypothetical protein